MCGGCSMTLMPELGGDATMASKLMSLRSRSGDGGKKRDEVEVVNVGGVAAKAEILWVVTVSLNQ